MQIVEDRRLLVMTQASRAGERGSRRSKVRWIMVRSPSSASTCFARAFRLRGQKRVPLPPARMIGRNSGEVLIAPLMVTELRIRGCSDSSAAAIDYLYLGDSR